MAPHVSPIYLGDLVRDILIDGSDNKLIFGVPD
jgi:hypothetical protein